jgi:osomolarity two-component system response regulator SKN7
VRQLNKYDFHKVKRPDDGSQSPYGPNASEFRHAEFRANRKDNLDTIRRKNPAPKKATMGDEQVSATNNIGLLTELVNTTQQQVQQLQEKIREMSQSNRQFNNEINRLRRIIGSQRQSQNELITYLSCSPRDGGVAATPGGRVAGSGEGLDDIQHHLRQAREYLVIADKDAQRVGAHGSQIEPTSTTYSQQQHAGSSSLMVSNDPMNDISRFPIYPVGQTVGIDPFHSDHINNIPYQLPTSTAVAYPSAASAEPTTATPPTAVTNVGPSSWGRKKPRVLLVEDDQTCSRIGSKFLTTMDCAVDVAPDGVIAVTKVTNAPEYFDLIFMDIIMPGLDGASATELIRQAAPTIPVIAMTSNIKPEDVQWYADHGMNGVLAKPFTKDGMLRVLKQHLPHLLKEAEAIPTLQHAPLATFIPSQHVTSMSAALASGPIKFESTPPAHSPSTTSTSWHSPSGYAHPSPATANMDTGYSVNLNSNGQPVASQSSGTLQRPGFSPDMPPPPGNHAPDDRPTKRPKVFANKDAFGHR